MWKQRVCYSFPRFENCKSRVWKSEKDPVKPLNFEPGHSSFDASVMKEMLRRGLQEAYPQAVALQFLPRPKEPEIPESLVAKHIADDNNDLPKM